MAFYIFTFENSIRIQESRFNGLMGRREIQWPGGFKGDSVAWWVARIQWSGGFKEDPMAWWVSRIQWSGGFKGDPMAWWVARI